MLTLCCYWVTCLLMGIFSTKLTTTLPAVHFHIPNIGNLVALQGQPRDWGIQIGRNSVQPCPVVEHTIIIQSWSFNMFWHQWSLDLSVDWEGTQLTRSSWQPGYHKGRSQRRHLCVPPHSPHSTPLCWSCPPPSPRPSPPAPAGAILLSPTCHISSLRNVDHKSSLLAMSNISEMHPALFQPAHLITLCALCAGQAIFCPCKRHCSISSISNEIS